MHSSLEWAVSAAASVAVHFLDDGFGVEIYEPDGSMHIAGHLGQHSTASSDLALSRLTDLRARPTTSIHYAIEAADVDKAGQLVVAIMGRMTPEDASSLLRLRRNRAQGLAMVIDIDTFGDEPTSERTAAPARARHRDPDREPVAGRRGPTWHERRPGLVGPGPTGSGCLMRASDRLVLASTVAVLLISFTARPLTTDSSYLGLSWFVVLVLAGVDRGAAPSAATAGFVFAAQLALLAVLLFVVVVLRAQSRRTLVRALRRPVAAGPAAHADPGGPDGRRRRGQDHLRVGDRRDLRAHRPAGQRPGPAGLGHRATGGRVRRTRPSASASTPASRRSPASPSATSASWWPTV